jgi:TonB family protein
MNAENWTAIVLMLVPGVAFGQTKASPSEQVDSNIACVERLELPSYPPLAAHAGRQATITASVLLTPQGTVKQVDTKAESSFSQAKSLFDAPVRKVISEARFRPDCAGKTVWLVFHFDLNGGLPVNQRGSTSFGYPSNFWIVSEGVVTQAAEHRSAGQRHGLSSPAARTGE